MSWRRFFTIIGVLAISSVFTVQGWRNVFNHLPTLRYGQRINTTPGTPGSYEELVLNVTTVLEPLLSKNMTDRYNDVQENLLNVMEERVQELQGKLVQEIDKKFGELKSNLFGVMESRVGELERNLLESVEKRLWDMEGRLMYLMDLMEKKMDEKMDLMEKKMEEKMEKMKELLSTRLEAVLKLVFYMFAVLLCHIIRH